MLRLRLLLPNNAASTPAGTALGTVVAGAPAFGGVIGACGRVCVATEAVVIVIFLEAFVVVLFLVVPKKSEVVVVLSCGVVGAIRMRPSEPHGDDGIGTGTKPPLRAVASDTTPLGGVSGTRKHASITIGGVVGNVLGGVSDIAFGNMLAVCGSDNVCVWQ